MLTMSSVTVHILVKQFENSEKLIFGPAENCPVSSPSATFNSQTVLGLG